MRLARRLLVIGAAVALVGCSGGEDAVPLGQRFPTVADAPGSEADPVEGRNMSADLDGFITDFSPALIDPVEDEMRRVFRDAGFVRAGLDVRFFGETHDPEAPHLFSWFIELESEEGATDVLEWVEAETMKPCPESCATIVEPFDVASVPDARGLHRIATAEAIETAGAPDEHPHENYWMAVSVGSIVYMVDLLGPPGSVTDDQAREIFGAFHARVTGG